MKTKKLGVVTVTPTTNLLDETFYREWYPDLAQLNGEELVKHWSNFGSKEKRLPNFDHLLSARAERRLFLPDDFVWAEYLLLNGDLPRPPKWGRFRATIHYLDFGIKEGRPYSIKRFLKKKKISLDDAPENFDWKLYLELNPTLLKNYINSEILAKVHYLEFGKKEGLDFEFDADFYSHFCGLWPVLFTQKEAVDHFKKNPDATRGSISLTAHMRALGWVGQSIPNEYDHQAYTQRNSFDEGKSKYEIQIALLSGKVLDGRPVSSLSSGNQSYYKKIGIDFEKRGLQDIANKAYLASLLWGDDGQVFEWLGNIALRFGQTSAAVSWYERAVHATGSSPFACKNLSNLLIEMGDAAAALDVLVDGLVTHPTDSSFLQDALRSAMDRHWQQTAQTIKPQLALNERDAVFSKIYSAAQQQYRCHQKLLGSSVANRSPAERSRPSVLIIGDHHIPQCIRYRISQKLEQFEAAGIEAKAVDWMDRSAASENLPWHDIVIFYRVPALPHVIELIASARAHSKTVFYEIDDLVIDPAYPHPIESYGGFLDVQQYHDLLQGGALMHAAARLCDYGIASTLPLQGHLGKLVRSGKCFLHRNGLDSQNVLDDIKPFSADKKAIDIFYGSATKAHNSDFLSEVLPALDTLLTEFPTARLVIAGFLELPERFLSVHADQVIRLNHVNSVQAYWSYLKGADINLAVLQPDIITDCKSELKWAEAATFGVASVVSATKNYLDVIENGVDGLISHTPADWYSNVKSLLEDQDKRIAIGLKARERVISTYGLTALGENLVRLMRTAINHSQARRLEKR